MAFHGTVALVTGAASGMGRLAALQLAGDDRVRVAAVDLDADGLAATADLAPNVSTYPCDVGDRAAVDDLVARVTAELGPVDRVVCAAGIAPTARLVDPPVDTVERVMRVNYLGSVHVVKAALPGMLDRGRGDVVVFASLAGWMPTPLLGAYSASKHALVAFCEVLSGEVAPSGLRVACVCPSIVDTPMVRQLEDGGVTSHHKAPLIDPALVVRAYEDALEAGELFVFPGAATRTLVRARRLAPGTLRRFLADRL